MQTQAGDLKLHLPTITHARKQFREPESTQLNQICVNYFLILKAHDFVPQYIPFLRFCCVLLLIMWLSLGMSSLGLKLHLPRISNSSWVVSAVLHVPCVLCVSVWCYVPVFPLAVSESLTVFG